MARRILREQDMGVTRVDIGDEDWVRIRTRTTAGDRAYIQKATTRMSLDDEGRPAAAFDIGGGNLAALERMLVEWGGPGFCEQDHDADGTEHHNGNGCKPTAITRRAIESLDGDTADRIVAAINAGLPAAPVEGSPNP